MPITILNPPNRNGLIAHYSFDENGADTAHDSSGNNLHGQLAGNPSWADGIKNKALKFNGVNQYIVIPSSINNNLGVMSKSVVMTESMWIRPSILNGTRFDFETSPFQIQDGFTFSFQITSANVFGLGPARANVADQLITSSVLQTGIWYFMCLVLNNGTFTAYMNGVSLGSQAYNGTINGSITTPTSIWIMAATDFTGGILAHHANGSIDDVRIYNKALSATEVWSLYNSL